MDTDFSKIMSLETINLIKCMANDPVTAWPILQDVTIFGAMVLVLSTENEDVAKATLEIFHSFAQHSELRSFMTSYIGVMDQLALLKESCNAEISKLASDVHGLLSHKSTEVLEKSQPDRCTPSQSQTSCTQLPLRELASLNIQNQNPPSTTQKPAKVNRRNSMLVRGGLKTSNSKLITLQVHHMYNRHEAELCRNVLIQIKGVISITLDPRKDRFLLRTKKDLKPEVLAKSIAKKTLTMYAEQVIKDDDGNEMMLSFGTHPEDMDKENENMPDYPDEDSPIKGDTNLSRIPGKAYETPSNGWSFMSAFGNVLKNSFYW